MDQTHIVKSTQKSKTGEFNLFILNPFMFAIYIYKQLHEALMGQEEETKWGSGFTCKERNKLAGHLLQKIRSVAVAVAVEKNPPIGYPFE